jgi:hypothetical protein
MESSSCLQPSSGQSSIRSYATGSCKKRKKEGKKEEVLKQQQKNCNIHFQDFEEQKKVDCKQFRVAMKLQLTR